MTPFRLPAASVPRGLLVLNLIVAGTYFSWWFLVDHVQNPILYAMLFFGEVYHILLALTFWYTVSGRSTRKELRKMSLLPSVDIFITVAGEPIDVVAQTVRAAGRITYPRKSVYILNDGYVANKDNWQEVEQLAASLGVYCITRTVPGGAKAGNINHALTKTHGDIIVIFDADMQAHPKFLSRVLPYFTDPTVAFVQTPQYYCNHNDNLVTQSAWDQQAIFFGPIMVGKDAHNAAFICGTNVALSRNALIAVGGLNETNIAEDFITSLAIHQKGYTSVYHNEVLATGLAPMDLLSYSKQQLRWARGSLEVLFSHNPLFSKGLTGSQKVEYLASGLFYLNGLIVALDIVIPLISLLTGWYPVSTTTVTFALLFIPYIVVSMYTLFYATRGTATLRALAFSQSSWVIHLTALYSVLKKTRIAFAVTSKKALEGNYISLVYPHLMYIALSCIAIPVGTAREGLSPAVLTNISWVVFNILLFIPFIKAAANWRQMSTKFFVLPIPKRIAYDQRT